MKNMHISLEDGQRAVISSNTYDSYIVIAVCFLLTVVQSLDSGIVRGSLS